MGWVRTDGAEDEEQVQLIIQECLFDLVRLQTFIFNARLVITEPLDRHATLSLAETRCGDWRIWEENEHDNAPCGAESTAVM